MHLRESHQYSAQARAALSDLSWAEQPARIWNLGILAGVVDQGTSDLPPGLTVTGDQILQDYFWAAVWARATCPVQLDQNLNPPLNTVNQDLLDN